MYKNKQDWVGTSFLLKDEKRLKKKEKWNKKKKQDKTRSKQTKQNKTKQKSKNNLLLIFLITKEVKEHKKNTQTKHWNKYIKNKKKQKTKKTKTKTKNEDAPTGNHRQKSNRRPEFKSWARLFYFALILFGKVWILLFYPQLWVNNWVDRVLKENSDMKLTLLYLKIHLVLYIFNGSRVGRI